MINIYDSADETTLELKEAYKTETNIFGFFYVALVLILAGVFVGLVMYLYYSYSNYIDPTTGCLIKIRKDVLNGNKEAILEAIKVVRDKTPEVYSEMCQYVDIISESYCLEASANGPQVAPLKTKGCYIKGTKTVFIHPSPQETTKSIEERADTLAKYVQASKNYWLAK